MSAVVPVPCSCILCGKQTSQLGIKTHYMRSHGTCQEKNVFVYQNKKKLDRVEKYEQNPAKCKNCLLPLQYEKRKYKFCSSTCAATYNNKKRYKNGYTMSLEGRLSISRKNSRLPKFEFIGDYTKVFFPRCKFCKEYFTSITSGRKICDKQECNDKRYCRRDQFSFRFNIFDYPDLFDLDAIKMTGWYYSSGRSKRKANPNGFSRDHRVSVSEAKANGYDPYYISHPLNCEIMLHKKNLKKGTSSSLTYDKLVSLVTDYENKHRGDR